MMFLKDQITERETGLNKKGEDNFEIPIFVQIQGMYRIINIDKTDTRPLIIPGGTIFTDTLLRIYRYNLLNRLFTESQKKDPVTLIDSLLDHMEIKIEIPEESLNNIPEKGPFIAVSNQPFRGIDYMILYKIIAAKRPDFKLLGNPVLLEVEPLREIIIPVNTLEKASHEKPSVSGVRNTLRHLGDGHGVGFFPAATDSEHYSAPGIIIDGMWNRAAIKLIRAAGVPVVPVYFHGTLPGIKYVFSRMNPLKHKPYIPSEVTRKRNRTISVRIGKPLGAKEQGDIKDIDLFGRYLRARVFSLSATIRHNEKRQGKLKKTKKPVPVIDSVEPQVLKDEFERIKSDYELFTTKNFTLLCTPSYVIPNIFREIGRLREITFREVGEGTNKSIDIDKYDFYFLHLIMWDNEENRIAGAYRLGPGDEIISRFGIKGFYISSLFKIKKSFAEYLSKSVELGRSFIVKDYQKKVIPLFLLWKGIMVFLLKHPSYRYLIGPVSISNDLSKFSKSLIVDYIKKWFFSSELAWYIKPRNEFKPAPDRFTDRQVLVDYSERDIDKIEKIIIDVEPGYRMPVLLKKYLEINGKIIGFNIDPDFNNCLDGLMILDLYDTPLEFIAGLSREMNDPLILDRFSAGKDKGSL